MEESLVKIRTPRVPYTSEEDRIILKQIELYPTNLTHAFEEASKLLVNRTSLAINVHYYTSPKLRRNAKIKVITCGSKKGFTQNVKNLKRDKEGNMPEQNLKGYIWVMKEMLELDSSERDLILNFFGIPTRVNRGIILTK